MACDFVPGCAWWLWDQMDGDGYCRMYYEGRLSKQIIIDNCQKLGKTTEPFIATCNEDPNLCNVSVRFYSSM